MQVQKKSTYSPPRYLAEGKELLELISCGQKREYHVRGAFSMHERGTWKPVAGSLADNFWLPARYLRDRREGEPDIPRQVEERRTLTAHAVARHLEGKSGWVGAAPASWTSWFAFDIDLGKGNAKNATCEDAEARRDAVLASVWEAFDFGTGRLPVVLLTPGGGYHVYVPLARDTKCTSDKNTWPAHVIRERVVARLNENNLKLRDGELEFWPSGKVLRLPMGRRMCLLHAQNPDDPNYLGLTPVHAKWMARKDSNTGDVTHVLKRDVAGGVRAFIDTFESARKPLSEWLQDDEAEWSAKYGPYGDIEPAKTKKKQTLISRATNVSQQYVEGSGLEGGSYLLRGQDFLNNISKLQRTGLTVSGGRHDAALKLTYYFGVCLGMGESESLAALSDWLGEFNHISTFRQTHGQDKFLNQTLREARHYYKNHVAKIDRSKGRQGSPVGVPLGKDFEVFEGKFSSEAVEEAGMAIIRFMKGYADSEGMVCKPVELAGTLLRRLCGERKVTLTDSNGKKTRVRATKLAIEELLKLGVLTLYKNYRVSKHGRIFCCWYQFGGGALPSSAANENKILATVKIDEGDLKLVSGGGFLARARKLTLNFLMNPTALQPGVARMYERHNFAPGDLKGDLSRHLGSFRDYQFVKEDTEKESKTVQRETGVVVKFDDDAGFGFISSGLGGKDLFVHQTNICIDGFRQLQIGEVVEFTRGEGEKGPKALWVRPTGEPPALPDKIMEPQKRKEPVVANSNSENEKRDEQLKEIIQWMGADSGWDEWNKK